MRKASGTPAKGAIALLLSVLYVVGFWLLVAYVVVKVSR